MHTSIELWAIRTIAEGHMWKLFKIYEIAHSDRPESEKLAEISETMRVVGIYQPGSEYPEPAAGLLLQAFSAPV